jgi:hypothetical protein
MALSDLFAATKIFGEPGNTSPGFYEEAGRGNSMMKLTYEWELPPLAFALPERPEDALAQCARGQASPDVALLQLLAVSRSESQLQEALGSAIWDALENRDTSRAERLGALQQLWDGDRGLVEVALR